MSSYKPQEHMQYSWDTEDNSHSTISTDIMTKDLIQFEYKGKGFNSDMAECAPNSTSYSRVTGSIAGHNKLIVESMLDGPKPLMKNVTAKFLKSPEQYQSGYWIVLSGANKTGRMVLVRFSEENKNTLERLINKQIINRK